MVIQEGGGTPPNSWVYRHIHYTTILQVSQWVFVNSWGDFQKKIRWGDFSLVGCCFFEKNMIKCRVDICGSYVVL